MYQPTRPSAVARRKQATRRAFITLIAQTSTAGMLLWALVWLAYFATL